MSSKPIILVTGGTGFLGSHVIAQLLDEKKYIVRATARQTNKLSDTFPNGGTDLQVVHIPSLAADHSEVLKGVWAVIHCAAPIPQNSTGKEIFEGACEGGTRIVEQAIKAGVKKIVVTATMTNCMDMLPGFEIAEGTVFSDKAWGTIPSIEDIDPNDNPGEVYMKAKKLSEKKTWDLAHENPDVDISTVIPPLIAGPFVPNFPPPADKPGLGSLGFVYEILTGGPGGPNTYPGFPAGHLIDVRDCAKLHILSLSAPPTTNGRDKRFLSIFPKLFSWKEVADIIRSARPELADRLPPAEAPAPPPLETPYDTSLVEKVLGFKSEEYTPVEKTFVDAIDSLVSWEKATKSGS